MKCKDYDFFLIYLWSKPLVVVSLKVVYLYLSVCILTQIVAILMKLACVNVKETWMGRSKMTWGWRFHGSRWAQKHGWAENSTASSYHKTGFPTGELVSLPLFQFSCLHINKSHTGGDAGKKSSPWNVRNKRELNWTSRENASEISLRQFMSRNVQIM